MMTLEQLIRTSTKFACDHFSRHGYFPYMWYVQSPAGQYPLLMRGPPNDAKDDVAETVRNILAQDAADSYVFIAEAWCVIVDPEQQDLRRIVPPGEHPDRSEVLMVYAEDGDHSIAGFFRITHPAPDAPPTLSGFEQADSADGGRFANLLPSRRHQQSLH